MARVRVSVSSPQREDGIDHPARHFKNQSCVSLGSGIEVAAFGRWADTVCGEQGGDEEGIRTVFEAMEHNGTFLNKLLKGSRKKPGLQVRTSASLSDGSRVDFSTQRWCGPRRWRKTALRVDRARVMRPRQVAPPRAGDSEGRVSHAALRSDDHTALGTAAGVQQV